MKTRIKVCGLTREADIVAAARAGVDAVGFVFYSGSKRYVSPTRAAELRRVVPAFMSVVALFVNATDDEVSEVQRAVQPELLQFHGDESPETCAGYGQRYMKALRVGGPGLETASEVDSAVARYADATACLFDSYTDAYGGSGVRLDRSLLSGVTQGSFRDAMVLAGGLTPQNVQDAVIDVRPWAVDVSSGVELAAGVKSADAIEAFVRAVQGADKVPMRGEKEVIRKII